MGGVEDKILNDFGYAKNDSDADILYRKYKEVDPFPSIKPALLNSADIADYVREVGLICPFSHLNLKPASYEMDLGGEILYWDGKDEEVNFELSKKQEIILKKNSITFVTVNATFRLPDYIALRFNLQIEHVHKGILLGTGPLVNPGFHGQLMIPLHNLTNNDYKIKEGDPLIGVEFTKLSEWGEWPASNPQERKGEYVKNKGNKSNKKFLDFIKKHVPHGMIVQSSLSDTINKTSLQMKKNEELFDKVDDRLTKYTIGAAFGLFIATLAVVLSVYSLISDANKYVSDATVNFYENLDTAIEKHIDKKIAINDRIKVIEISCKNLEKDIERIRILKNEEIENLENKLLLKSQLRTLENSEVTNNVDEKN